MADVKTMIFDIIAKDNAGRTLHKVGTEADVAGKKTHNFGKIAAVGLAGGAVAAAEFGKKSVEAYSDAAKESMQLSRVTGMTIKQSSRLRFAAEESGVEFSTLSKSMRLFSKSQSTATGQFAEYETKVKEAAKTGKEYGGHLGTQATAFARLGISLTDAHGKMVPMNKVMAETADQFKTMPDGPDKTALAMQMFGKSGADMIKLLNKGSEGLKEFAKESDKTGNTISDTSSLKKSIQAQREFHAAITGLEIQVGQGLQPIITNFSVYMTEHVAPMFTKVTGFVKANHEIFSKLVPVISALGAAMLISLAAQKAWAITQAALLPITALFKTATVEQTLATEGATAAQVELDAAMTANPIGLVVVALGALVVGLIYAYKHSETFRKIVTGAFHAVQVAAAFAFNWIKHNWKLLLAIIVGPIGLAVYVIARHWSSIKAGAASAKNYIKDKFNDLVGVIRSLPSRIGNAASGMFNGIKSAFRGALNWIIGKWNSLSFSLPGVSIPGLGKIGGFTLSTPNIPRFEKGGVVKARPGGTLILAGEGGYDEKITPMKGPYAPRGGSGDDFTIRQPVVFQVDGKTIWHALLEVKRRNGGISMGLA
jgi:hypothetical protein